MIERAVMSLWTGPRRYLQPGGLALWSLSALHFSRRFRELALVTDGRGMELLVERLGLPFSDVELMPKTAPWTSLTNVWALGKLYAVAHEVKPFIHFDSDVLLTGALPHRVLTAQVCFERPVCHLCDPCETVYRNLTLPCVWTEAIIAGKRSQWGCGLMGGTDVVRVSTWAMSALRVAETNAELLKSRHGSKASIFLEQWSAARAFSVGDVEPLFRREHPDSRDESWHFYRHLGGPTKIDPRNIERVAAALEREWPGQLAKCQALEAELIEGKEIETTW
jgi:hypothetical protein